MRAPALCFALLLGGAAWAAQAQTVVLSGVAGAQALLVVDGSAPKFVRVGQTHLGVKLLSVQGDTAVVDAQGQRQTLRVGEAPVSVGQRMADAGAQRTVLTADSQGHFMPQGQINGRTVQFMVDTGATWVILSEPEAKRIQLKYEQGPPVRVSTANGTVQGRQVQLDSVKVGNAQVFAVQAIVLPQAMPYVLLGNSFLTRFQMQRQNDQLTLERRY